MSFIPKPHEIYKHFKGNLYQIVTIAEHSETGETMVVYQALYGDFKTYVRPLEMFTGKVDRDKYPEAAQEYRFELQGEKRSREYDMPEMTKDEAVKDKICEVTETDTSVVPGKNNSEAEQLNIDPLVLEFLDADSYEQQLNILAALHHRITDEMITTMAIASDIEVAEGDIEERYESLKNCLLTLEKYECNRLR